MPYLNVNEVSKILNVNEETIRRWIRDGKLSAEKHGGRIGYRIDRNILNKFISENKIWQISSYNSINTTNSNKNNKSTSIDSKFNNTSFCTNINSSYINEDSLMQTATILGGAATSSLTGAGAAIASSSSLGSILGSAIATFISTCSTQNFNSDFKNSFKSSSLSVDSLIRHIEIEINPLLNIDSNISYEHYIELISTYSKLQSTLSSYLSKIEKAKSNLESNYSTENINNSNNL